VGALGRPLRRTEDRRLITGSGAYLDDLEPPGTLHAAFVRCSQAHAMLGAIDIEAARNSPGVYGVFTAADLGLDRPMPNTHPSPLILRSRQAQPLASGEVCHVGEPVAVVVATTRRAAVDATELVEVDEEPLPAVASVESAIDGDTPVHRGDDSNLVATLHARYGEVDDAFGGADHISRVRLRQHRGAAAFMETRGVLANVEVGTGDLMVWSSTQAPYALREHLSRYLGLAIEGVRVAAPDVGGGFGPKAALYAEEYVVAALALSLGRPVKWVESRREHFLTTLQMRDQICDLEAAVDRGGRLRGVRGRILHDSGAYVPYGFLPAAAGLRLLPGPYVVPAMDVVLHVVATNLPPTSAIRGAARPYAVFAMERLIDAVGRDLGIGRAEVRRRNFIRPDQFPYRVGLDGADGRPIEYDSGDYEAALDLAIANADLPGVATRKERSEGSGLRRGVGIASYVEDTGLGPFDGARVTILPTGTVVVDTGAAAQGQGHATVFAQICAEALGVDPASVVVRAADTSRADHSGATVASRSATTTMSSVHLAAQQVADLARRLAAFRLEAAAADIELAGGTARVIGQPGTETPLGELAAAVKGPLPDELSVSLGGSLHAEAAFRIPAPAYAFGTHVAEVEVDPETGLVTVDRYTVAHDCGRILNPMIVAGQIDGGVAHGLGNALMERVVHDDGGQPLATTFVDYRIPAAEQVPSITKVHTETPSPRNPLGAKGAGEGGTLPAMAAVAAAVDDALSDLGVVVDRYPLLPETVRSMIRAAQRAY
jgi:aerobic carbon-monoxide dehydrogenase large subunit